MTSESVKVVKGTKGNDAAYLIYGWALIRVQNIDELAIKVITSGEALLNFRHILHRG